VGLCGGGCTKFCVKGLIAGNRRISRSGYDRKHKETVPKDLIDSLLANYKKPEDLIAASGPVLFLLSRKPLNPKSSKCGVNV